MNKQNLKKIEFSAISPTADKQPLQVSTHLLDFPRKQVTIATPESYVMLLDYY